jgi:AraC-like DNA-binding protein
MLTHGTLTRLSIARDMLQDARYASLSISAIAATSGLSVFHFIRQFRVVFGETPNQYRARRRLENAKQMLVSGSDSVTDICMAVGYSSLGSFSALFSRQFGQAPSAYRQRLSGEVEQLTPDCMTLLRAAWCSGSQFSRSEDAPV